MIRIFINNFEVIFLTVIVFIFINLVLRKFSFEIRWRWKNSWLGKFSSLSTIIWLALVYSILALVVSLQQTYNFINLGKAENYGSLVIGILTLYGIFYTFIQFAIGYASQSEKDKHWGRSKAKALLTGYIEYKLFLSANFKLLLVFCSIYPILKINQKASHTIWIFISSIIKIEKNFLVSIWAASIFCIYILYILLFVKSLMVMRKLFESQEHGDYSSIRNIEYNTIKSYQNLFCDYFNNKKEYYQKDNYFMELLIDDLNAARPEEKKIMLKAIVEESVYKYISQQRLLINKIKQGIKLSEKVIDQYQFKSKFLAGFFKELFSYIDRAKVDFNFVELLSFFELQDKVLYNQIFIFSSANYKEIIDGIISVYEDDDSWTHNKDTIYFHVPDLIWNKVDTYDKMQKLSHCILERNSFKALFEKYYKNLESTEYTKNEKKLLDEYDDYICRVIDKCKEFQNDFNMDTNLNLFKALIYDQGKKKIEPVIQEKIYHYIKSLEYNESNKLYIEVLIKKLEYKYILTIIFYFMLYTGGGTISKWKNDVLFLKNINSSFYYDNKINSEENINFVSFMIKESYIGNRISRELITWILNHINSNLTTDVIQACNKQDYMSYARFLKFKYIFETYGHFYPNFSNIDLDSVKVEGWSDWRVSYLREMLETPTLLKEEFFSTHQFRFSQQVLKSCLHKHINETQDFRLFYINMVFSLSENQFISMTKENSFMMKGITDFLILKLDDKSYEYLVSNYEVSSIFIKNVKCYMDLDNKSVKNYINELIDKANECSKNILPIITKNRIIVRLQKLLYGEYNRAVIE